jgi:hypothetical protein
VERRYSFYSFSISALHGRDWSASRPGSALSPGKGPSVPVVQEAGRAPEPVWTQKLDEKFFRLCRGSNLDRPVVQPVIIIIMSVVPLGTYLLQPSRFLAINLRSVQLCFPLFSWTSFPFWKSVWTFHDPILVLICVYRFVIRYPSGFRFFVDFLKTCKNFSMGR